jgi:hypothetical protein
MRNFVTTKRQQQQITLRVTDSLVSSVAQTKDGVVEGGGEVTVQRTGTGQYDFVLSPQPVSNRPILVIGVVPSASARQGRAPHAQLTNTTFRVVLEDNAGAAQNGDFCVTIAVFRTKEQTV